MQQVSIFTALGAGFISFVSPCVLPLVPAYLSYISGVSLEELGEGRNRRKVLSRVTVNSLLFILGFSTIFIVLGASASFVGRFMAENKPLLEKIAGVVIVIFGIHLAGLFRLKFLDFERKVHLNKKPIGTIGSFIVGIAFAFGWTPCIGPILASILAMAAVQETVQSGMTLLVFYSLGLGIPFLLSGIFINLFFSLFSKIRKHFRKIEIIGGILLIIVGVLVFTGQLQRLAYLLPQIGY